MNPTDESQQTEEQPSGPEPLHELVLRKQGELKRFSKVLSSMASVLNPLSKESTFVDAQKALGVVAKAQAKVPSEMVGRSDGGELIARIKARLEERIAEAKERMGSDLKLNCEARGLKLRVINRDGPVELRVAPLGIVIDREKGEACIQFAREVLEKTPAEADVIMAGYDAALKRLNSEFDPAVFFKHCFKAWQAVRSAAGAKGDRVEVMDFLPYLALQRQGKEFRRNPIQKNFQDYTRVQFAWDVLRLRQAKMFVLDGWRLNIGAASGTSASNKNRVIFMEDENGQGEYKLTVYFGREEIE